MRYATHPGLDVLSKLLNRITREAQGEARQSIEPGIGVSTDEIMENPN